MKFSGIIGAEEAALSSLLEVAPRRSDAEIVVVNSGTVVDDAFIAQVPSMQMCVTNTSGFDHLDLTAAKEKESQLHDCRSPGEMLWSRVRFGAPYR